MDNDNEQYAQRHVRNRIASGVILVGIGLVLFADKLGVILPHWLLTWPMLVVVIGLYSGFKHNFSNASWIIITAVGAVFLWDEMVLDLSLKPYVVPIVLVALGLIIILRPKKRNRFWGDYRQQKWERKWGQRQNWYSGEEYEKATAGADPLSDDLININCVLSGVQRTVISKTFKGGRISCVLGGAEIDFTKADIQGTAVLQLHEILGGITLYVPSNWSVRNNISGILHGVEDERRGAVQEDPGKVLLLQGSAVLAGVEIKSY